MIRFTAIRVLTFIFAGLLLAAAQSSAYGQFTIKIPKVKVPKTNAPTTSQPTQTRSNEAESKESPRAEGEFRIGDEVEIYCDCFGRMAWTPGRIESVSGGYYTVRYGSGRYQTKPIAVTNTSSIRDPKRYAAEQAEAERRRQFMDEARPYWATISSLANVYDSRMQGSGYNDSAEFYAKAVQDLNALNGICQKYPNLTNQKNLVDETNIAQRPADWCVMAGMGEALTKKAKSGIVIRAIERYLTGSISFLESKLKATDGRLTDDTQKLLFSRAEWEKGEIDYVRKQYAEMGEQVPADFFGEIYKKADELKNKIEQEALTRSWEAPSYNRPVEQALARAKFVEKYKGATVLKIGSSYGDWKIYRTALGIPTDRYIRGWALLKIPNRPHCQAQEWIVKQDYTGGGRWSATRIYDLGGSGVFMKCQ